MTCSLGVEMFVEVVCGFIYEQGKENAEGRRVVVSG